MFGTLNKFFRDVSAPVAKPETVEGEQPARELVGAPVHILRNEGLVHLGSGLIDHSQKMTTAAMQIADMKVWAHRS